MAIKKQEFYEGAALHQLARAGAITCLRYEPPFFLVNHNTLIHLKYSTKARSPWGFTFTSEEQALLEQRASKRLVVIGLICGSDGVAAIQYDEYRTIANARNSAVHVACYRGHREYYEIIGPKGQLQGKVAPSAWQSILE